MTLGYIILANLLSTLLSLGLAGWLSFRYLGKLIDKLVPVSAGLLLATAITHLLPEAFNSEANPFTLGWVIIAGILGLFVLEKLSLIHHTHHHEGDEHHHESGHDAHEAGRGGVEILIGDTFHNMADGIMIAGAFLVDTQLGIITTLAVMAHEIPQEIGEFMILLNAGFTRRRAFAFNLISGLSAVVGRRRRVFRTRRDTRVASLRAGTGCVEPDVRRAVRSVTGDDAAFVAGEVAAASCAGDLGRFDSRCGHDGIARALGVLAGRDGPSGVGNPLAPRTAV